MVFQDHKKKSSRKKRFGKREAEPRHKVPCKVCDRPMLVARGQQAKYHKACRKLRHNKKVK